MWKSELDSQDLQYLQDCKNEVETSRKGNFLLWKLRWIKKNDITSVWIMIWIPREENRLEKTPSESTYGLDMNSI